MQTQLSWNNHDDLRELTTYSGINLWSQFGCKLGPGYWSSRLAIAYCWSSILNRIVRSLWRWCYIRSLSLTILLDCRTKVNSVTLDRPSPFLICGTVSRIDRFYDLSIAAWNITRKKYRLRKLTTDLPNSHCIACEKVSFHCIKCARKKFLKLMD